VRILGEGQFEVSDDRLEELNKLDDALADAVAAGDKPAFERDLTQLLDRVREVGTPVADETLVVSDVILPGPDASLADVEALLTDEGLIPG
jgi:hypothetical protein